MSGKPSSVLLITPFRDWSRDEAVDDLNRLRVALIESLRTAFVLDTKHALRLADHLSKELYRRGAVVLSQVTHQQAEADWVHNLPRLTSDMLEIARPLVSDEDPVLRNRILIVTQQLYERGHRTFNKDDLAA